MAKHYKNNYDDDSLFGDDFDNGNDMAQFENYEKFEIEEKAKTLTDKAKEIIDGIANAYLSLPEAEDEHQIEAQKKAKSLIENIKYIESSNLAIMLEQVHIARHLMSTMIRRLDSGGYTNDALYEMIQEQQKQVMNIIMQFSKYARALPDYFEVTRSELKLQSPIQVQQPQQLHASAEPLAISSGDDQSYTTPPIRGTLELALSVQESIKKLNEKFETTEATQMDFDPADLVEEEEFDLSGFDEDIDDNEEIN